MLKAADLMIHSVFVAHQDEQVESVLRKFVDYGIGGMPIVDNANHLVGYISDGDIMRAFATLESSSGTAINLGMFFVALNTPDDPDQDSDFARHFRTLCAKRATEVGGKKTITVHEQTSIVDIAKVLSERKIKKVPVERDGQLVGIVSRGDVIRKVVYRYLRQF